MIVLIGQFLEQAEETNEPLCRNIPIRLKETLTGFMESRRLSYESDHLSNRMTPQRAPEQCNEGSKKDGVIRFATSVPSNI